MIAYITDEQIEAAKRTTEYSVEPQHRHNDCIRVAYQWLDAQRIIKNPTGKNRALKHIIEKWAGFHISISDVEVAARLHPDIHGTHPYYNIHGNLVHPAGCRLVGLVQHRDREPVLQKDVLPVFEHPDPQVRGVPVKIERRDPQVKGAMTLEQVRRSQQRYKRW
jgi:hypothetical protein